MRVSRIDYGINFVRKDLTMRIPSDVNKISNKLNLMTRPTFAGAKFKPIPIPISDTFVHVLK